LTEDNKLYIWGKLNSKRAENPLEFKLQKKVKSIACRNSHIICLVDSPNSNFFDVIKCETNPQKTEEIFKGMNIAKIRCGTKYTMMIDSNGSLLYYGKNNLGQLSLSHKEIINPFIFDLKLLPKILDVSCGKNHAAILCEDKKIYSIGSNVQGQLGVSSVTLSSEFIQSEILEDFLKISCGYNHSVALTTDHKVIVWGGNEFGQLGLGTRINVFTPQVLELDGRVTQILGAGNHTFCLTDTGEIWGCGFNRSYQCCTKNNEEIDVITRLPLNNFVALKIGGGGFCVGAFAISAPSNLSDFQFIK